MTVVPLTQDFLMHFFKLSHFLNGYLENANWITNTTAYSYFISYNNNFFHSFSSVVPALVDLLSTVQIFFVPIFNKVNKEDTFDATFTFSIRHYDNNSFHTFDLLYNLDHDDTAIMVSIVHATYKDINADHHNDYLHLTDAV